MSSSTEPNYRCKCAGCNREIQDDEKYICCSDNKCKNPFHHGCVNLTNPTQATIKSWSCPSCLCAKKKGGDNTLTPVRPSDNVTVRKPKAAAAPSQSQKAAVPSGPSSKAVPQPSHTSRTAALPSHMTNPITDENSALSNLTVEIKGLRQEILGLRLDFETAISAVNRCEERIDELNKCFADYECRLQLTEVRASETQKANARLQLQVNDQILTISTLEARLTKIEEIGSVNCQMSKTCESLKEQLSFQSQVLLRNDVEINGVPESASENPHHIFQTLAAVGGMSLAESDIDSVWRAGPPRAGDNNTPRPIVVRFCRRQIRDQFFSSVRPKRLTTKHLGFDGPSKNIYINDRLTRENRLLFRECRTQFKAAGYRFCWTKGGQIYVKKHDGRGEGAKAVIVRSLAHMARILQKPDAANESFRSSL